MKQLKVIRSLERLVELVFIEVELSRFITFIIFFLQISIRYCSGHKLILNKNYIIPPALKPFFPVKDTLSEVEK